MSEYTQMFIFQSTNKVGETIKVQQVSVAFHLHDLKFKLAAGTWLLVTQLPIIITYLHR